jgi:hypothetical protein
MIITCIIRKESTDTPVELFADNKMAIERFNELNLTEECLIHVTEI